MKFFCKGCSNGVSPSKSANQPFLWCFLPLLNKKTLKKECSQTPLRVIHPNESFFEKGAQMVNTLLEKFFFSIKAGNTMRKDDSLFKGILIVVKLHFIC